MKFQFPGFIFVSLVCLAAFGSMKDSADFSRNYQPDSAHFLRSDFQTGLEPAVRSQPIRLTSLPDSGKDALLLVAGPRGKVMVIGEKDGPSRRLPLWSDFSPEGQTILRQVAEDGRVPRVGTRDENPILLIDWPAEQSIRMPPADPSFFAQRSLIGRLPDNELMLSAWGGQLSRWIRETRYCGACGGSQEFYPAEVARWCPNCEQVSYPPIKPAVLIFLWRRREHDSGEVPFLVEEILLARAKNFRGNWFSVLAGYVDPGENLEKTVAREVEEEVGLRVRPGSVTYLASQAWPLSGSLMIAFHAEYESGDIVLQEEEIAEAGWYGRGQLPPTPGAFSLSGQLISAFDRGGLAALGIFPGNK